MSEARVPPEVDGGTRGPRRLPPRMPSRERSQPESKRQSEHARIPFGSVAERGSRSPRFLQGRGPAVRGAGASRDPLRAEADAQGEAALISK
eukprot:3769237-Pyramimonas_sp.AAC.1